MAVQPTPTKQVDPVSADIATALQSREAQLEVVLDNIADVVYLIDVLRDGGYRFVAVNARFLEATGLEQSEVIGRRVDDVIPEPSLELVLSRYAAAIASREPVHWEEESQYPAGTRVGEVMVAPVFDETGRCVQLVGTVHDITERRRQERQLHQLAHFDALTGLPNRRHFQAALERGIRSAQARGSALALLYLDVDRFKHVNDRQGHAAGDRLLALVSERIMGCIRGRDLAGRLGGDEFGIIAEVPRVPGAAATIARQLLAAMRPAFEIGGEQVTATASVGIAVCPDDSCDAECLMRYADTAMYHAKAEGRNACRFYTPRMNVAERARRDLEAALRQAVERSEFVLHYQPQVELASGRWVGAEALLRWRRPGHGLVSPCSFIGVLEQTGLIVPAGRWVIAEACRQIARWRAEGMPGLAVSVNISARQLPADLRRDQDLDARSSLLPGDEGLCAFVEECLRAHAVPRGALELELTESALMADPDNAAALLGELKALGVCIQVDDFGTGYSSLAYLKRFPIDALKIDRAFIDGVGAEGDDRSIVRAILSLARSLNLRVIAEGVEREEQRSLLLSEGCQWAQGYLFARPMPAEAFVRALGTQGGHR